MKLIVPERGSAHVGRIWENATNRHSSVALLAEARAALARARRLARLTDDEHAAAVEALFARWGEVEGLELTESLAGRAGELAATCALRGYEAIHLASAEAILDDGDVLVVSDVRLAAAAASIGIEALVPTEA